MTNPATNGAATGERSKPHANCYWLPERNVLAGDYPGDKTDDAARKKLNLLLDAGVRRFIDLTESRDPLLPYRDLLFEEAARRGVTVEHLAHGLPDMSIPDSPAAMSRVLGSLVEGERSGETTYVHCWGGIGRTGTVVGCYLVSQGETPEVALATVQRLFSTMSADKVARHPRSPQTAAQREYVLKWGERGAAHE